MAHCIISFTILLFWLLLSLVALQDTIALSPRATVTLSSNNLDEFQSHKKLSSKTDMMITTSATKSKLLKGRKILIRAENIVVEKQVMKVEDQSVKTTVKPSSSLKCWHRENKELKIDCELRLAKSSSKKPYMPLDSEDASTKTMKLSPSIKGSDHQLIKKQPNITTKVANVSKLSSSSQYSQGYETQDDLFEGVAELLKMLNKDYHQRAHRSPPINNDQPFQHHVLKP